MDLNWRGKEIRGKEKKVRKTGTPSFLIKVTSLYGPYVN